MEEVRRQPAAHVRAHRRRGRCVLLAGLLLATSAFVLLTADVWRLNGPARLDRFAARMGFTAAGHRPLRANVGLTHIGEWLGSRFGVALGAAALFVLALARRDWVVAAVALLSPVASFVLIEYIAKPIINEPIQFGGRSYPSGHAAGIAAVALSAATLLYRQWGWLAVAVFAPVAVATIAFVGVAVLRLGFHHYVTDVAGGVLLGAIVVLTLTGLLDEVDRRVRRARSGSRNARTLPS